MTATAFSNQPETPDDFAHQRTVRQSMHIHVTFTTNVPLIASMPWPLRALLVLRTVRARTHRYTS